MFDCVFGTSGARDHDGIVGSKDESADVVVAVPLCEIVYVLSSVDAGGDCVVGLVGELREVGEFYYAEAVGGVD